MKEETGNWLEKAEEDFETAEVNCKNKRYDASAFFCQQAIEKALEIERLGEFDKTHDLYFLGKKLDLPQDLLDMCDEISEYYVETRYPDTYAVFDETKVSDAVEKAKKGDGVDKKELIESLNDAKEKLPKEKKVEKVILFGSHAEDKARKGSDADLIIVSSEFRGIKYGRAIGLRRYFSLDMPVDLLCYTPEEFAKKTKGITIVREALKRGIEV